MKLSIVSCICAIAFQLLSAPQASAGYPDKLGVDAISAKVDHRLLMTYTRTDIYEVRAARNEPATETYQAIVIANMKGAGLRTTIFFTNVDKKFLDGTCAKPGDCPKIQTTRGFSLTGIAPEHIRSIEFLPHMSNGDNPSARYFRLNLKADYDGNPAYLIEVYYEFGQGEWHMNLGTKFLGQAG